MKTSQQNTSHELVDKTADYCRGILGSIECLRYPFHNLGHTQEVVTNSKIISSALHLSNEEIELIQIAAWFHDIGFSTGYRNHEEKSKQIAKKFLKKENVNNEKINLVCLMIEATKMPQNPKNIYDKVLCDADLYHISSNHWFYRKLLLRREWEQYHNVIFSDLEWYTLNLEFLASHQFKTEFGRDALEEGKQTNITKIEEILKFY